MLYVNKILLSYSIKGIVKVHFIGVSLRGYRISFCKLSICTELIANISVVFSLSSMFLLKAMQFRRMMSHTNICPLTT